MSGKRKRGKPKKTWKKQVEEEAEKSGLKGEDAQNRDKWRDVSASNRRRNGVVRPSLLRRQHVTYYVFRFLTRDPYREHFMHHCFSCCRATVKIFCTKLSCS